MEGARFQSGIYGGSGRLVRHPIPRLLTLSRRREFVETWVALLLSLGSGLEVLMKRAMSSNRRRRRLKERGPLSRIAVRLSLSEWGWCAGLGRISFRWGNCESVLSDLWEGFCSDHDTRADQRCAPGSLPRTAAILDVASPRPITWISASPWLNSANMSVLGAAMRFTDFNNAIMLLEALRRSVEAPSRILPGWQIYVPKIRSLYGLLEPVVIPCNGSAGGGMPPIANPVAADTF